jgi:hypothetical protein
MRLTSAGNLGLNTATPNYSGFGANTKVITSVGAAADAFGVIELAAPSVTSSNRFGEIRFLNLAATGGVYGYSGIRVTRDGADNNSAMSFWTSNAGNAAERMRIDNTGSVLISTTTGGGSVLKFIVGDGTADTRSLFKSSNPYSLAVSRTGGVYYIGTTTDANPAITFSNNGGTERARLTDGGNFLIGTTTDSGQKLQVAGETMIGNPGTNTYQGGFLFYTLSVAQNTTTNFFAVPDANWAGITEISYVGSGDYNRSGAALVRWAYENVSGNIGIVNTIYDVSQNATLTLDYSGGYLRIKIAGGAVNYRVQFKIQGSQAV